MYYDDFTLSLTLSDLDVLNDKPQPQSIPGEHLIIYYDIWSIHLYTSGCVFVHNGNRNKANK